MESPATTGEIYNVGATERISILELAERVRSLVASQSEFVFVPYDEVYGLGIEDTLHREPAIEKIRAAIDWQPHFALERILLDVIAHTRTSPLPVDVPV